MQNSSDKSQPIQDDRKNGFEDLRMMTIEYLRARLLSERSISKATKERADELATRVKELEEKLKVVTLQRKRAEKAAVDVYLYLDSLGVSDISVVYESDTSDEDSQCDSDMGNGNKSKEIRINGKEPLGSELECTPSSGGPLSWKGSKESTQLLEKKSLKYSVHNRTSLSQVKSSPRHRFGKSCRRIKRREPKSTLEESRHDSNKSDPQGNNTVNYLDHGIDNLDFQIGELRKSPETFGEECSGKDNVSRTFQELAQEYDAGCYIHECKCSGEMERALQHQEELLGCYKAREKAQRDWEDKYCKKNDSCEPGSHSDVTEERDENKAAVPQPIEVGACHDHEVGTQTSPPGRKSMVTHFNSFKISPDVDRGSSDRHNVSEMQLRGSPDFVFSVVNNNQSSEHAATPLSHAGVVDPSYSGSASCEPQLPWKSDSCALVPHEEPSSRVGTILESLQEAKLLLIHMNSLPETRLSVGRAVETFVPENRDVDWLKLPVGCPGLFRVPTDLEAPSASQSRLLGSDYSSESTSSTLNARTLVVLGHQYITSPTGRMGSRLSIPSGEPFFNTPDTSCRQPRFDFQFDTNISASSNSNDVTNSDFFQHVSSNPMMGTVPGE